MGKVILGAYSLDAETAARVKLPKRLAEISGLALTDDGRLLAHDDEMAVVYELDQKDGSIVKWFALSDLKKPTKPARRAS